MVEIQKFVLGPVETNTYLVGEPISRKAVVIDPAWDGEMIVKHADSHGWQIEEIWLTHAHFDHVAGVKGIIDSVNPKPEVCLHPEDFQLWQAQGGAPFFGMHVELGDQPSKKIEHGQVLYLGDESFEVRHAPGHTPGHVIYFSSISGVAFCGDVIFWGSIGRTDLPGGDYQKLMNSIQTQILTLPPETRLLSGHGPETTVAQEMEHNPYLIS